MRGQCHSIRFGLAVARGGGGQSQGRSQASRVPSTSPPPRNQRLTHYTRVPGEHQARLKPRPPGDDPLLISTVLCSSRKSNLLLRVEQMDLPLPKIVGDPFFY